jgi:acyl-CoA reductase-like NAD-dependent aldehyde dehydrogenase
MTKPVPPLDTTADEGPQQRVTGLAPRHPAWHGPATLSHAHTNGNGKTITLQVKAKPQEFRPISPNDRRPLEPVRVSTAGEIRDAVAKARSAQEHWRLRPLADRVAALKRAAKEMLARRAEIIALSRDEMGKVEIEGLFNEAMGPLDAVGGWAGVVERAIGRRVRLNPLSFPKKRARVDLVPRGVIGVIAPWNFPVAGLYRPIIPALLTGNGVVVKPSEFTPRASAWLIERLAAELPEGLIQVVQGAGDVGSALIDAGIDACVFTGSPATGRKVRIQCAERGIPSSIEMGGKDAAIVLADCDLDRTVAGVTHWSLSNAGQACGAIEVAYVDQRIADEFVERLRRAWVKLRVGPLESGQLADIAPMANQRQLDIVAAHVEDARAKGATIVCGGSRVGTGLGYAPTLVDNCAEGMAIVDDETFGPVLAVVRVDGAAEAIRLANRSRYGLGASIWTSDIARAERLAERLDVGVVTINNHSFSGAIAALPWSGTRETGFGVANGPESLATFVRPRATITDEASSPEFFWLPFDRTLWEAGDIVADAQIMRLARAWKLPLLMRRRVETVRKFFR